MAKKKHETRLTVKFDPEGRPVRLRELRKLVHNLAACLDHLSTITLDGKRAPEFAIADLFAGSAGLQVAPDKSRPVDSDKIIRRFKQTARAIYDDSANGQLDARTLELFRKLAFPASKQENRLWFDDMPITTQFLANIDKRLEHPVRAFGQLKGRLERVNVHGMNEFIIYPPIITTGIRCVFPDRLMHKVGGSLKRSVTVQGVMLYRGDDPFPHFVEVEDIVLHPLDEKLPKLSAMKGIAPNCTGKMSTLDFLGSLHHD